MFVKCAMFVAANSLANFVWKALFEEIHKKHEPVLRDRLGFNSIHEYMVATPEEIRQRQKRF